MRCYLVPYCCYNSSSSTALGFRLPILIYRNDVFHLSNSAKCDTFQLIEHEEALIQYFHSKFSLSNEKFPIRDDFSYKRHYWLFYIHTSLNIALDELKSLIDFDKIESAVVNVGNLSEHISSVTDITSLFRFFKNTNKVINRFVGITIILFFANILSYLSIIYNNTVMKQRKFMIS